MEHFYSTNTCVLVWLDKTAHALIWGQDATAPQLEHLRPVLSSEDLTNRRVPHSPLDFQLAFLAQFSLLSNLLKLHDNVKADQQWVSDTVLSKAATGDPKAKAAAASPAVTDFCRELKALEQASEDLEAKFKKTYNLHDTIMMDYDKEFKAFNADWVKKISAALNKAGIKFQAEHETDLLHSLNAESPQALTERAAELKVSSRKGEKDKALIGRKGIPDKDTLLYRISTILIERSPL